MATLPKDVIFDILSRLPAKFVVRFKIVCKLWNDLIYDTDFIKLHLERSLATQSNLHFVTGTSVFYLADFDTFDNPIELDSPFKSLHCYGTTVVGSCHGLLCCWNDIGHSLFLYNPTTQTHKMLPYVPRTPQFDCFDKNFNFGFGYDSYSGDYKVVTILFKHISSFESQVMVYSLKAKSWRRVQDLPYNFYNHGRHSVGAFVVGAIHWVGQNDNRVYLPILSFDLKDETFGSIPLPDFDNIHSHISVGELDACLCLLETDVEFYKVWIMKEYGRPESWMQLFRISKRGKYKFLERTVSFSINKKQIFLTFCHSPTVKLDLETMEVTDVKIADFHSLSNTWVCVENLVILKCGACVRKKCDGTKKSKNKKKKKKKKRRKNRRPT